MDRKKDISPTKVALFVALRDTGLSQREIAQHCGICQSVVQRCLARYTETGSFKARKRPSRTRMTSERSDNLIKRLVKCKPTTSSSEIRVQLPVTVSVRTLRRRLSSEMGLKSYKSASKPLLSKKNIRDRLLLCQLKIGTRYHFPCNTACLIKDRLAGQHIEVLGPWRGFSSDLNPIEHCWVVVKRKVSDLKPTSYNDLVEKIKQVWCQQITEDFYKTLVESMPDRIRAVLDAKGGPTRY